MNKESSYVRKASHRSTLEPRQMINLALASAADAERQGHTGLAAALRQLAQDCQLERSDAFSSIRVDDTDILRPASHSCSPV